MMSNCAVSVAGGTGNQPVYSRAVLVRPDLVKSIVQIPLGKQVTSGIVTLVFDLHQPGRIQLAEPKFK